MLGVVLVTAVLTSCGGGADDAARTVLVDYRADDFASSFLNYYPRNIAVHPGDTITFKQTWTGEPHSVTMGTAVNAFLKYLPYFEKYENDDAARAAGVDQSYIDEVNRNTVVIPGMTDRTGAIYQPGARPCFIERQSDVPAYLDADDNLRHTPDTDCPPGGDVQPAFTGRQAFYNSGYIPFQGQGANTFTVRIAKDAAPGTYAYFCNYHWVGMQGTVKIVAKSQRVPSPAAVRRTARDQAERDARATFAAARKEARAAKPVAGVAARPLYAPRYVSANEYFPHAIRTKVGEPVTWRVDGLAHTISFNVPSYFPVFTLKRNGDVNYDARASRPAKWTVPPPTEENFTPQPRTIDVGEWNGSGGFHSSGLLNDGDSFTLRFTKPGTYPYACAVHPQMIGRVVVTA